MKKQNKIVLACVCALLVVIAVFAVLNRENVLLKRQMVESGSFRIVSGEQVYTVSMKDIEALNPAEVAANYKKDGKAPIGKTYTGVPLKRVLDSVGADVSSAKSVSFTAADGYASAVPIQDALNEESCFIVIREGGEALGSKETGGSGPFMMILAQDQFSQRWCKFLLEVTLN